MLLVVLAACRSGGGAGPDVAVIEPALDLPPPPPPVAVATPAATPVPPLTDLLLADLAFEAREYGSAVKRYRAHLAGEDPVLDADRALFRLGVLYLMSDGPAPDADAGHRHLRRLLREHPESPYLMEAQVILGLTARVEGLETEVERLESQLEALKRIDLQRSPDHLAP